MQIKSYSKILVEYHKKKTFPVTTGPMTAKKYVCALLARLLLCLLTSSACTPSSTVVLLATYRALIRQPTILAHLLGYNHHSPLATR